MRCVEINNAGVVVAVLLWGEAELPPSTPDGSYLWHEEAQPGWVLIDGVLAPPAPPQASRESLRQAVNADRDRRIRTPFGFGGSRFDYDDDSQKRITGAAALAGFALTLGGKQPGDMRWHGGDTDFAWIDASNALVPMDAVTCFAFGQAAAAWESAHVFAARALKDAIDAAPDKEALDAIDITAGWPV